MKLVCTRVAEEGGEKVYQGSVVQSYNTTLLKQCAVQAVADLKQLDIEMRSRLEWSDVQMLRSVLAFLDTQSWCHPPRSTADTEEDDMAEIKQAVEYISTHFREPLEAASVNLASIQDKIEEVVDYARNYLCTESESYHGTSSTSLQMQKNG